MQHDELISLAAAALNPRRVPDDRLVGDVASALVTATGRTYVGVCIDTASGTGFCAEHAAAAAMVTAGEQRVAAIVAVWRDPDTGALHVLPPCGRCRELVRQLDDANLRARVVLGRDRAVPLAELLPEHAWPEPLDGPLDPPAEEPAGSLDP